MKTASDGVVGLVVAVVGSEARSSEETVVAKECVVGRLSRVEADTALPSADEFEAISWFSIDSERSALRLGSLPFVNTGRGGDVSRHVAVVGTDVCGTDMRDAFRGPRLSLGKLSCGLLIRRVISVKTRRDVEIGGRLANCSCEFVVMFSEVSKFMVCEDRKLLRAGRK